VHSHWRQLTISRYVNAAFNIVSDILIAILPLPRIRELNIAKRSKVALIVVFALGGFTCIVSILRLESLYSAAHLQGGLNAHGALAAVWSDVEIHTAILCSCLPTLRTLVTRAFPTVFGSTHHTNQYTSTTDRHLRNNISHKEISSAHHRMEPTLSGRDRARQHHNTCARGDSPDSADISLEDMRGLQKNIHVTTVIEQETERHRSDKSEQGSTRDLIGRASSYSE
jgi:hypothetical protein